MTQTWEIDAAPNSDPVLLEGLRRERAGASRPARGPPDYRFLSAMLLEELKAAADFIEEEADNRAAAGSEMSDYEREPRELAERFRATIRLAESSPSVVGDIDE